MVKTLLREWRQRGGRRQRGQRGGRGGWGGRGQRDVLNAYTQRYLRQVKKEIKIIGKRRMRC